MVRRLLSLLSQDVSGVHAAAYLLALSSFFSQLLALIRDRLLAHTFGAGTELDIYYAAFRVQDFIFFAVASLVSLAVLIPVLIEKMERGKDETRKFLDSIFSVFFVAMAFLGGITAYFTPHIVPLLFPGLLGRGFDADLISLTRILLLSPLILGLSNLLASVTQAYKKFFIYALSPLLYNVGIIAGIVFLYPVYGLKGLGFGVIIGALLHLFIQLPFIISEKLLPRFTFISNWVDVRRVVSLSLPRTLTLSLNHVAMLVLIGIASLLTPGSISVFSFSYNLESTIISIIGASYSIAAFPILARHFLKKEQKEFIEHFTTALKHIIFWSFPAMILLIVLRAQIVRVILGSGAFSWNDTRLTAACLALLALSVVAQNISLLFIRAFYAAGDTRKPLIISIVSSLAIIISAYAGLVLFKADTLFSFFIESLFRVQDLQGTEVLVLPLAYSIGSILNVLLFWFVFRRFLMPFSPSVGNTAFHSFAASILTGLIVYKFLEYFGSIFNLNTFSGIFFQGALSGLFGLSFFILMLYLLRNEEFSEIMQALRQRVFRVEVVRTDADL